MKIFIVAAAAWVAGALLGYFVARLAYKHLRKRLRTLRQERKPPKKKMGTMDRILVLEAVFLVAYTVADLVVFWHTGSEPATLTGCVFGVCGLENGVMGWIKTNKDKAAEAVGTSGSGTQPPPEEPPPIIWMLLSTAGVPCCWSSTVLLPQPAKALSAIRLARVSAKIFPVFFMSFSSSKICFTRSVMSLVF